MDSLVFNFTHENLGNIENFLKSTTLNYTNEEVDDFSHIYSQFYVNLAVAGLYILGLCSCLGLLFVVWFEISGQAGQFRTLLNQLASYKLCLHVILYTIPFGTYTIRGLLGPVPTWLCSICAVVLDVFGIQMLLTTVIMSGFRFSFVFIFKSIPIMNDQLLNRISFNVVIFLTLFMRFCKFYIEEFAFPPGIVSIIM